MKRCLCAWRIVGFATWHPLQQPSHAKRKGFVSRHKLNQGYRERQAKVAAAYPGLAKGLDGAPAWGKRKPPPPVPPGVPLITSSLDKFRPVVRGLNGDKPGAKRTSCKYIHAHCMDAELLVLGFVWRKAERG